MGKGKRRCTNGTSIGQDKYKRAGNSRCVCACVRKTIHLASFAIMPTATDLSPIIHPLPSPFPHQANSPQLTPSLFPTHTSYFFSASHLHGPCGLASAAAGELKNGASFESEAGVLLVSSPSVVVLESWLGC